MTNIAACELILPPLSRPAEFSIGPRLVLLGQEAFPSPPPGVRQANPGEVKEFVNEDAPEFPRVSPERGIEHKPPLTDERGGMNFLAPVRNLTAPDAHARPPLQVDGRAIELRRAPERVRYRAAGSVKYFSSLNCIETDLRTVSTH